MSKDIWISQLTMNPCKVVAQKKIYCMIDLSDCIEVGILLDFTVFGRDMIKPGCKMFIIQTSHNQLSSIAAYISKYCSNNDLHPSLKH